MDINGSKRGIKFDPFTFRAVIKLDNIGVVLHRNPISSGWEV
jgi:hypothetical protein